VKPAPFGFPIDRVPAASCGELLNLIKIAIEKHDLHFGIYFDRKCTSDCTNPSFFQIQKRQLVSTLALGICAEWAR
jgi:hypothetical protein